MVLSFTWSCRKACSYVQGCGKGDLHRLPRLNHFFSAVNSLNCITNRHHDNPPSPWPFWPRNYGTGCLDQFPILFIVLISCTVMAIFGVFVGVPHPSFCNFILFNVMVMLLRRKIYIYVWALNLHWKMCILSDTVNLGTQNIRHSLILYYT